MDREELANLLHDSRTTLEDLEKLFLATHPTLNALAAEEGASVRQGALKDLLKTIADASDARDALLLAALTKASEKETVSGEGSFLVSGGSTKNNYSVRSTKNVTFSWNDGDFQWWRWRAVGD